jgi:hypothetical protein
VTIHPDRAASRMGSEMAARNPIHEVAHDVGENGSAEDVRDVDVPSRPEPPASINPLTGRADPISVLA